MIVCVCLKVKLLQKDKVGVANKIKWSLFTNQSAPRPIEFQCWKMLERSCGPASPNLYRGNEIQGGYGDEAQTRNPAWVIGWLPSPWAYGSGFLALVSNFKRDEEVRTQENATSGSSVLARNKVISYLAAYLLLVYLEPPMSVDSVPLLCSSGQRLQSLEFRGYCWGYSDPFSESKRSAHLSPCQSVLGVCRSLFSLPALLSNCFS